MSMLYCIQLDLRLFRLDFTSLTPILANFQDILLELHSLSDSYQMYIFDISNLGRN